jgi:putative oxidoreductase
MDVGILLLRMTVGLALAAHGTQIVFGWFGGYGPDGTGQFMEGLGFRPGRRHALAAGFVELVGGLLLTFGFLTPLASALIASVMVVAVVTVHWKNGFFITSNGYEFNLVLGVAALSIAFTGPGALSVDSAAGYAPGGIAWGVGAAAVAVVGAIGQLVQRR